METTRLVDAVAGLCLAHEQAATDRLAAKATYQNRSRAGVLAGAGALGQSYSVVASELAEATKVVDADVSVDPPRSTLLLNLARLTEVTRLGLARLGITTPPCKG